jgi:hypothetical protein
LNDLDQSEGQTASQTQTAADSWKFYGLPKGSPGTQDSAGAELARGETCVGPDVWSAQPAPQPKLEIRFPVLGDSTGSTVTPCDDADAAQTLGTILTRASCIALAAQPLAEDLGMGWRG